MSTLGIPKAGLGNADDSDTLYIGYEKNIALSSFDGLIDDARVYNRALSASEISALYNAGTPATTAADSSGNSNTGTLTNSRHGTSARSTAR